MPASTDLVTLDAIRSAANRIRGAIRRTPLLPADRSAGPVPGDALDLWLKCECLQYAGAFKLRGAYNFISSLSPEVREEGVVTYSSGNHAQGVAYAARAFGVPALVVMPVDAPEIKVAAVRRLGARLEMAGTTTTDRKARAEELLADIGGTMVPPFDHPDIIAGQGTAGLEIVEQLRDLAGCLFVLANSRMQGSDSPQCQEAVKWRAGNANTVGPVGNLFSQLLVRRNQAATDHVAMTIDVFGR